ncbi:MAG: hypothetical protein H6707_03930 [Deltaproteobacteria bacterium]|nr:hypothetical protein [Deltaproteobacteria bacterium]
MGLVENQQALSRALANVVDQRVAVLRAAEQWVGDDEAVVRAPRIDAEAALLTPPRDEGSIEDLEVQSEAALHLVPPLERNRRRAGYHDVLDALSQQQLRGDGG